MGSESKRDIQALNARIRVLEEENEALSEKAEEMLLLGMVAESVSAAGTTYK